MVLSLVVARSCNFGWSSVYDCKAYLETNTVKNCSYFGFGGYFFGFGNTVIGQVLCKVECFLRTLHSCLLSRASRDFSRLPQMESLLADRALSLYINGKTTDRKSIPVHKTENE